MTIVPAYAAFLALIFVTLSIRTLRLRRTLRIALGDAGNDVMLRAMRVHSNFAEYVPLSVILLYLVEVQGARPALVNGLCLCLLVGRLSHAFGVSQANENYRFRVAGMALTLTVLVASSVYLLLAPMRNVAA